MRWSGCKERLKMRQLALLARCSLRSNEGWQEHHQCSSHTRRAKQGTHRLDTAGRANNDVWALVLVLQLLPLLLDGQAAKEVPHPHVLHVRGEPATQPCIEELSVLWY